MTGAKKQKTELRKRIPIRQRFFTTVLLVTIILILAVSITGLLCIRWIRSATNKTLTEQLELNLQKNMQEKINAVDASLKQYEDYIVFIADYINNMYDDEDELIADGKMFYPPGNTKEYELTRGFASKSLKPKKLKEELLFFSNLEKVLEPIAKENRDIISTIYLGTKNGLLVSYDKYSYLSVPPEGKEMVYNYFVSEWYKKGMREDGVFCTEVYMDSQGRGLTMTVGSVFKDKNGEPAGVVCLDFDLTSLYEEVLSEKTDEDTFIFALDVKGNVISPDSDTINIQDYTGLNLDELDELRSNPGKVLTKDESVYVCVPMESAGWTLCAREPESVIQKSIHDAAHKMRSAFIMFAMIVIMIIMVAVVVIDKAVNAITHPLELLDRDIKIITDGDLSYRATVYSNDEIGDITSGMNAMVDRLNFTLNELMSSQEHAETMSRLATHDALTGVMNKTAFNRQLKLIEEELADGKKKFGFVQLDMNNLKIINDNYGHDKGDIAIKNLCSLISKVYANSPVFRVGGDEFVVILKGVDYRNAEELAERFREEIRMLEESIEQSPWKRVSAAIGYALYDEEMDSGTDSVLSRADKEMYNCKRVMKQL